LEKGGKQNFLKKAGVLFLEKEGFLQLFFGIATKNIFIAGNYTLIIDIMPHMNTLVTISLLPQNNCR